MRHSYIRIVRIPGAPRLLIATFAGALPIGMLSLAVLLLVQEASGSLSEAGGVAGALTVGNAAGVALQGRLIDRWHQTPVLLGASAVCAGALVLLVLAAEVVGSVVLLGTLAVVAGGAIPATTSSMRVLWPTMVEQPELRASAYALLALMFTVALVLGPLLVSLLMVLLSSVLAVLTAAALSVVAAALFASAPAARRWRASGSNHGWRPRALSTPGSRTLIGASLLSGLTAGIGNVAVPAVAIAAHAAALSGVLLSLASIGDGVVGLAYGSRAWRMPAPWRLALLQACSAVISGAKAFARAPLQLAPLMVLGGAAQAPAGITTSSLLDEVAAEGALTEAYTVMVGASLLGSSLGYTLGGRVVHTAGPGTAFTVAGMGMAAVAVWTAARHRTLKGRRSH